MSRDSDRGVVRDILNEAGERIGYRWERSPPSDVDVAKTERLRKWFSSGRTKFHYRFGTVVVNSSDLTVETCRGRMFHPGTGDVIECWFTMGDLSPWPPRWTLP